MLFVRPGSSSSGDADLRRALLPVALSTRSNPPPLPSRCPARNETYDDPLGDIAVVSSDDKHARVNRLRLRAASQVFFDILEPDGAGGSDTTEGGLPFIDVSESSADIGQLLKMALQPLPADSLSTALSLKAVQACVPPGHLSFHPRARCRPPR